MRKSITSPGVYIGNPARRMDDPKRIENILKEIQMQRDYDQFEMPKVDANSNIGRRGKKR